MPHNARNGGSVPCRLTEISDASAAQVADLFLGTFALIIQCYCLSILSAPGFFMRDLAFVASKTQYR